MTDSISYKVIHKSIGGNFEIISEFEDEIKCVSNELLGLLHYWIAAKPDRIQQDLSRQLLLFVRDLQHDIAICADRWGEHGSEGWSNHNKTYPHGEQFYSLYEGFHFVKVYKEGFPKPVVDNGVRWVWRTPQDDATAWFDEQVPRLPSLGSIFDPPDIITCRSPCWKPGMFDDNNEVKE